MEGLDTDMDIEQIEMKIARMKREIARKQQKLRKWEKAAKMMKDVCKSEDMAEAGTDAGAKRESGSAVVTSHQDPASPSIPLEDLTVGCEPDNSCIGQTSPSAATSPRLVPKDSHPKVDAKEADSAACLAPRRSSRQPRCSYILNSDEFITLDFLYARSKRKQVSPESDGSAAGSESSQAASRFQFPQPPAIVVEQPIVDFFLPEDEFAAWKIRFRRKNSLRSCQSQAHSGDSRSGQCKRNEELSVQSDGDAAFDSFELPMLTRFESLVSLDTLTHELVELVHCGRIFVGADDTRAIAAVQKSKISVWIERGGEWKPQLSVPLFLEHDGFYKFSGFNSKNSMGLALISDTGGECAVWCYDLSAPGQERCLESVAAENPCQTCTILSCVVGETLVYARVGSKGTQLKTYRLNASDGKQLGCFDTVKDALNSLQPVTELKEIVIGFSATILYVWNHETGELCKQMQAPGNLPFLSCTFAQAEAGLLMLGVVTGASNPRHNLVVVNPARHKWRILREYQDVVELPNQCLQGTIQMGQHLAAGGGIAVGRVAIWNIFSGNLAAFLNDGAVTTVCSFPAERSRDILVTTGTRQEFVLPDSFNNRGFKTFYFDVHEMACMDFATFNMAAIGSTKAGPTFEMNEYLKCHIK